MAAEGQSKTGKYESHLIAGRIYRICELHVVSVECMSSIRRRTWSCIACALDLVMREI